MPREISARGILFLVVGPNGSGKGSVIDGARRRFADDGRFVFPRRVITGSAGSGGEIYQTVTPAQFDRMRRDGAFFLCWGAHGVNFGIPAGIEDDLKAGRSVVVTVSRTVIAQARAKTDRVTVIELAPRPSSLAERLIRRGRDAPADIEDKSDRSGWRRSEDAVAIDNNGPLEVVVGRFCAVLGRVAGPTPVLRRPAGAAIVTPPL